MKSERTFILRQDLSKKVNDKIYYRVQSVENTLHAKIGEIGGWVEDETCLGSRKAWIKDEAMIDKGSVIKGRALVEGNAVVTNNGWVGNNARIKDNAVIDGAVIFQNAEISENARMGYLSSAFGNTKISGDVFIKSSRVYGVTELCGNMKIEDSYDIGVKTLKFDNTDYVINNKAFLNSLHELAQGKISNADKESYFIEASKQAEILLENTGGNFVLTRNAKILENGETAYQVEAIKDFTTSDGEAIPIGRVGGFIVDLDSLGDNSWIEKDVTLYGGVSLDGEYLDCEMDIRESKYIDVAVMKTFNKKARLSVENEDSPQNNPELN